LRFVHCYRNAIDTNNQAPMNPMAIIPSKTAVSCKRLIIASRISSMTYSSRKLFLANQHSLKDTLRASSALTNKLQGKGRAKLNLLILVEDRMNVREFLTKMARMLALGLG